MVTIQTLLELQKIDTGLMQLLHRNTNLEERKVLTRAQAVVQQKLTEQASALSKLAKAKTEISDLEAANKKCESQLAKYSQQLKTVIAPREAEALQHEIATVSAERSANDDLELVLLETSEKLESQIKQLANEIDECQAAVVSAKMSLDQAILQCDAEKKLLEEKRINITGSIDAKLIKLYEAKRNKRTTPAVADLHGSKCQSCHLDLSVVELAGLKKLAPDQIAECPNCDCYLAI